MLTHGEVRIALEARLGESEVSIHPDSSSSSHPPLDNDTPEYWQLCMITPKKVYSEAGTLYNSNSTKMRSSLVSPGQTYAIMEKEEVCKVPQAKIDVLAEILKTLTEGRVFDADEAFRPSRIALTPAHYQKI